MKRAVVVFSGGQDSTTCLIQALQQYDEVHCVTFDYGQRHRAEIEVAQELSEALGAKAHKVLDVTLLNELAISSLTRDNIPVPAYDPNQKNALPSTFVPGRNILFLTLAAIYAYQVEAEAVITGVCETDFSGYPDCRDEFVKALNQAVVLGIARDIRFETPLMWLNKAETWALADYYQQLDRVRRLGARLRDGRDLLRRHGAITREVLRFCVVDLARDRPRDLARHGRVLRLDAIGAVVARAALDDAHLRARHQFQDFPGLAADVLHPLVAGRLGRNRMRAPPVSGNRSRRGISYFRGGDRQPRARSGIADTAQSSGPHGECSDGGERNRLSQGGAGRAQHALSCQNRQRTGFPEGPGWHPGEAAGREEAASEPGYAADDRKSR